MSFISTVFFSSYIFMVKINYVLYPDCGESISDKHQSIFTEDMDKL